MTPLRKAVGLVDGQQTHVHLRQELKERGRESLGAMLAAGMPKPAWKSGGSSLTRRAGRGALAVPRGVGAEPEYADEM